MCDLPRRESNAATAKFDRPPGVLLGELAPRDLVDVNLETGPSLKVLRQGTAMRSRMVLCNITTHIDQKKKGHEVRALSRFVAEIASAVRLQSRRVHG